MANTDTVTSQKSEVKETITWGDKIEVYTTAKVAVYFPVAGTPVTLHRKQAEQWLEKGYATDKPGANPKQSKPKEA